jgi:hypothetical protein
VQDLDPAKPNYVGAGKTIADHPGRLNINLAGHPLKGDWLHLNSVDYNATLDQLVFNSVQGEFYVVDHGGTFVTGDLAASVAKAATSTGDFLYRFGDPVRYGQGTPPVVLADWTQSASGTKQLGGAHGVCWIEPGLTGAGRFLIFSNAQYLSEHTPQSYVLEIDPFIGADGTNTGKYVNPPDAGYTTITFPAVTDKTPRQLSKQVTWHYYTKSNLTLFSNIGCSAQRLPNGNTLICATTRGYFVEVTAGGEIVWEFINPVTTAGIVQAIGDCLDPAAAPRQLRPRCAHQAGGSHGHGSPGSGQRPAAHGGHRAGHRVRHRGAIRRSRCPRCCHPRSAAEPRSCACHGCGRPSGIPRRHGI